MQKRDKGGTEPWNGGTEPWNRPYNARSDGCNLCFLLYIFVFLDKLIYKVYTF